MSSRGEVLPSFLPASGIEFRNFYITSTFGKQLYCTDKSFSLYVGITSTSYSFKGNSTSTIKIGRAKTTFISKQLLCHLNFWKTAYTVSFIVQRSPSLCMLALLQPHNLLQEAVILWLSGFQNLLLKIVLKFEIGYLVQTSMTWLLKQVLFCTLKEICNRGFPKDSKLRNSDQEPPQPHNHFDHVLFSLKTGGVKLQLSRFLSPQLSHVLSCARLILTHWQGDDFNFRAECWCHPPL